MTQRNLPQPAFASSPRRAAAPLLALVLLLGACGPTARITTQWRDESDTSPPLQKVVVFASKNDETRKRVWEDAFVRELQAAGVRSIAAYTIHEGDVVDTVAARKYLVDGGYDAAVIIRSRGSDTRTTIIPGTSRVEAVDTVYDPFWHRFRTIYEETRTPDIEETSKVYYNDTTVFRPNADPTKKSRLVWAGTTESEDPKSSQESAAATAKEIVKELTRVGLVRRPAAPADPFPEEAAGGDDD